MKYKTIFTVPTLAEQMHNQVRCVPKIEKFSKNREGMTVATIMENIQITLADSSLFISVSFMVPLVLSSISTC